MYTVEVSEVCHRAHRPSRRAIASAKLADAAVDEQALVSEELSLVTRRVLADQQTGALERNPTRRGPEQPLTNAMTATYLSLF